MSNLKTFHNVSFLIGQKFLNHIGGIMIYMFTSSVIDCGLEPWLGQSEDYKIGICCFCAKHAALRRKIKDWLARNQDDVSK